MWHFYKRQNDFLFASDKEIDYEDIRAIVESINKHANTWFGMFKHHR